MNATRIFEKTEKAVFFIDNGDTPTAEQIIRELNEEAAAEIRRATAKASGNRSRQKAAERVIKSAKKTQLYKEALHGAWIDESGKQCICDGFRGFRINDHLPLETIPEGAQPPDVKRIIGNTENYEGAQLDLPDVPTLKAHIKTEKARKKALKDKSGVVWDFGDSLPAVNAEFLLDVLEILPNASATTSTRRPEIGLIYFESAGGCGVLCPVRK